MEALALHLAGYVDHLVQGWGDEAAKADQVGLLLRAVPVVHAIEAGEVARCLRRCHDVIRRQRVLAVRQRHVHQRRTELLVFLRNRRHQVQILCRNNLVRIDIISNHIHRTAKNRLHGKSLPRAARVFNQINAEIAASLSSNYS